MSTHITILQSPVMVFVTDSGQLMCKAVLLLLVPNLLMINQSLPVVGVSMMMTSHISCSPTTNYFCSPPPTQ